VLFFEFQVENERCGSVRNLTRHTYLHKTGRHGVWKQVTMNLKSGVNVLSWQLFNLRSNIAAGITSSATTKIRLVEIHGK